MSDTNDSRDQVVLTDEARLRMFRKAGDAERANQPRWMILISIAVLATSAAYALLGWLEQGSTIDALKGARAADSNLNLVLDEIRTLSTPLDPGGIGPFDPLPNPQTLLERFATRAGLDAPDPPTASREQVGDRISRRKFQYGQVRHPSPDGLIRWLDSVERGIVGMRVEFFDLRPNALRDGWQLSVTFSRLETSS